MEPRTPVQLNMEELWKYPPFAGLEVKRLNRDEEEIWVITDTQGEPPMDWDYKYNKTWHVVIKRNGRFISSNISELIPLPHNRIPIGQPIQLIKDSSKYKEFLNAFGITTGQVIKHRNIPYVNILLDDGVKTFSIDEKWIEPIPDKPIIKIHYYYLNDGNTYYVREGETNAELDECIIKLNMHIQSHVIIN